MTISWRDASEIVAGLVYDGVIPEPSVRPEMFVTPYDDVIKAIKGGTTDTETLIEMFGLPVVQAMLDAKKALSDNTTVKTNWVSILEKTYSNFQAGVDLEKLSKKMKAGEAVDLSSLTHIAAKAQAGQAAHLTPASKIAPQPTPFVPCGWKPLDDHLVGLPEVGLVVVGARPGTGKTWWSITLAYHFLLTNPDKRVAFFSVEMPQEEVRERMDHLSSEPLPDDVLNRWLVDDDLVTAEEIINRSSTIENLGMVIIDYSDLIVRESSEPEYTRMYLTLAKGAKSLHCPIILLAQLSGSYDGGLPKPQHLRYTRLAEAVAWMILMLWNPNTDTFDDPNNTLPIQRNVAYCIVWKVRGGFKNHLEDSPGAIAIPFRGESWHPTKSKWFSLTKDEQGVGKKKR